MLRRDFRLSVCSLIVCCSLNLGWSSAFADGTPDACPPASAAAAVVFFIERAEERRAGTLRVRVPDEERVIADDALAAWTGECGQAVIYSTPKGAGGYENEGQSLWIYDFGKNSRRKVMAAYFAIDRVIERRVGKRNALIVEMHDSGLGASHVAVVDAARGEVFLRRKVRLLGVSEDALLLAFYDADDWEQLVLGMPVKPRRIQKYRLSALLQRPVITRSPMVPE